MSRISVVNELATALFAFYLHTKGGVEKNAYPIILWQSGRLSELVRYLRTELRQLGADSIIKSDY